MTFEPSKVRNPNYLLWRVPLGMALIGEGLWFVLVFAMAPLPYPYQLWLMLLLWASIVACVSFIKSKPQFAFAAACFNLAGCIAMKDAPGGVTYAWLWVLYYHSVDALIVGLTYIAWRLGANRISLIEHHEEVT